MTIELTPGANCSVPTKPLVLIITTPKAVDVSLYRLTKDGRIRDDEDMIFYGRPSTADGSVRLRPANAQANGVHQECEIDVARIPAHIERVSIAFTCDATPTVGELGRANIGVSESHMRLATGDVNLTGRSEAALILGELYRRNGEWKFRFIAQGFNGGLQPLAEHYGVTIDQSNTDSSPPPAPVPPPPAPTVNLSKVSLTKSNSIVRLEKRGQGNHGQLRVNLNWNQQSNRRGSSGGFLNSLMGRSSGGGGIDLDLGAFVRYRSGRRTVIQALGDRFNDHAIRLLDDDRTGSSVDGEWIHIDGRHWDDIEEVMVYAFIYEGVPSWDHTDAVVTLHVPDQPPIETRLTDGDNAAAMCAIARLVNDKGAIRVERINRYFKGHQYMDEALGWGFKWQAGQK